MSRIEEPEDSLWWLAAGPTVWAAHFLASYGTVAVWCAKVAGRGGSLGGARVAVAIYTAAALALVLAIAARGYRRHKRGDSPPPHDADTPEDRHRFLGLATLLLAGLSAVAVAWDAVPAATFATCR